MYFGLVLFLPAALLASRFRRGDVEVVSPGQFHLRSLKSFDDEDMEALERTTEQLMLESEDDGGEETLSIENDPLIGVSDGESPYIRRLFSKTR